MLSHILNQQTTEQRMRSPTATSDAETVHSDHAPSSFSSAGRMNKRKRSSSHSHLSQEYGIMRTTSVQDMPRFVGSGSGIHFIRSVYLTLAKKLPRQEVVVDSNNNNLVPGEDDQLPQNSRSQRNEQNLWGPEEVCDGADKPLPSFEQLVNWTRSYFEIWHPVYPYLNAPDVIEVFERLERSSNGIEDLDQSEMLILRSILSISVADSRQGRKLSAPVPTYLLFRSVDEALASSQLALRQPASIRTLQAAFAIQLFLVSLLRFNSASRLGGLIVRMAFQLGLHRCPDRYSVFTQPQCQLRKRVFWSVYSLQRLLSHSLGLPLDIRDDDVDTCYIGEEQHGRRAGDPPILAASGDPRLRMFTMVAKRARLTGLILELRNKNVMARAESSERVATVQAELVKWFNSIQDLVDTEDLGQPYDVTETPLAPEHRLLLSIMHHESVLALNRPLMGSNPGSPTYAAALQNCIGASISILNITRRHQIQHSDSPNGLRLLNPMVWPSLSWALWISAFMVAFAAIEGQIPITKTMRLLEHGKEVLKHVATRDASWPEYCLKTLDELSLALQDIVKAKESFTARSAPPEFPGGDTDITSPSVTLHRPSTRGAQSTQASPFDAPHNGMVPLITSSPRRSDEILQHSRSQNRGYHSASIPSQTDARHHPGDTNSFQNPMAMQAAREMFTESQFPTDHSPESLLLYNQLFGDDIQAVDFPFLAANELNIFPDPMFPFGN